MRRDCSFAFMGAFSGQGEAEEEDPPEESGEFMLGDYFFMSFERKGGLK